MPLNFVSKNLGINPMAYGPLLITFLYKLFSELLTCKYGDQISANSFQTFLPFEFSFSENFIGSYNNCIFFSDIESGIYIILKTFFYQFHLDNYQRYVTEYK